MTFATSDCIERIERETVVRLGVGESKRIEAVSLKSNCGCWRHEIENFGAKTGRLAQAANMCDVASVAVNLNENCPG